MYLIDKKPGGPPAKEDKNKKPEETVSAEEKERHEREAREKEEKLAAYNKWWEDQSEQDRFQMYCEDKYREPRLQFAAPHNGEGAPAKSEASFEIVLSGPELQKFEQEINDRKGLWLYFDKLPPTEEEAAAKGGKPVAGKPGAKPGAPVGEEIKPINGRIWIDLTQFGDPNQPSNLTHQRFAIQTVQKQHPSDGSEVPPVDHLFEAQQTYIMISVSLSDQLYPSPSNDQSQQSHQLPRPQPLPSTKDAINDFNTQLEIITKEISFEYSRLFNSKDEQASSDKGLSPRKAHAMTSNSYNTPA